MKQMKSIFIAIGVFIFTLHSIIPHFHESELSADLHQEIHENEKSSLFELISFYFHETTEEGQLDHVIASGFFEITDQDLSSFSTNDFIFVHKASIFEFNFFSTAEILSTQRKPTHNFYPFGLHNRPPPMIL